MTLADLSSLGSFISALAVAGSLIYLGLQTHQAAKHTKALIQQGRISHTISHISMFSDPALVAASIEANGQIASPEAVKGFRLAQHTSVMVMLMRDAFNQHSAGRCCQSNSKPSPVRG